ncbi:hypothetical protein LTR93_011379, partial [Exophiala xenobiotica]
AQLKEQCRKGRKLISVFARQLLAPEQKVANLEKRLENISRRQNLMLDREARALGELEANPPLENEPEQQVMGFEDNFFLADDPNLLEDGFDFSATDLVFDDIGELGVGLGPGVLEVPMYFPTDHSPTT